MLVSTSTAGIKSELSIHDEYPSVCVGGGGMVKFTSGATWANFAVSCQDESHHDYLPRYGT